MECSLGTFTHEDCENDSYGKYYLKLSSDFTKSQIDLLKKRSKLHNIVNVCTFHEKKYLDKYNHLFGNSCCDPFSYHKKVIKKQLREITVELSERWPSLIPGKSVCCSCHKKLSSNVEGNLGTSTSNCDNEELFTAPEIVVESINQAGSALGVSPTKIIKLSDTKKHLEVRRTVSKFSCAIKKKLSDTFTITCESQDEDDEEIADTAIKDMEIHIENLKKRIKTCTSNNEKIQVISVVPKSWSMKRTAHELDVSEYLVRRTREIVKERGVIPQLTSKKKGKELPQETRDLVVQFYENDEVSRICPGMKDTKSVRLDDGKKELKQKRLILCNLKELYQKFREEHQSVKVGFSTFCILRPKWCILAGASGTHSVCVCSIHQNFKLMTMAVKTDDWKVLLENIVCDLNSEDCMFGECPNCPEVGNLKVDELLQGVSDDDDITYSQWIVADHCNLVTIVEPHAEFKEKFVSKLVALKKHHFISQSQSQFLKSKKENLQSDECVIILDFSENYTFIIQDEIQSYHWMNSQATIHPFCVYYRDDAKNLCTKSLCVISDCMNHNTVAVYTFQTKLIHFVKSLIPNLNRVAYFSDGSAAQYKNRFNFSNLCKHKEDFGLEAEWHFFATSHGKGPCDGIGGTVKRLVAKTSLQRPKEGHIITPMSMFQFCVENIKGINFVFVGEREVQEADLHLKSRFDNAKRILSTRDQHCFKPKNTSTIQYSIISASFDTKHKEYPIDGTTGVFNISDISVNDIVVCVYDNRWYIGRVCEVSQENSDIKVVFYTPGGPSTSFSKTKDDVLWVEMKNVLDILKPTEFTTITDYTLLEEMSRRIETAAKDPCKYYTRLGDLPVHLHRLKKAAIERTIHLDFLPKNFSRHKANTTYLNWHTRSISWHVEWVFAQANITCVDDRLPEDERLAVLASKYLDPARCDEALGESLQFYHSQGLAGAVLLLKTEHPSRFYELDPSTTLRGSLRGKYLIEFPTIHVVLKDHRHAYPIVDSDDEEFGSFKSIPPRFNGYMNTVLPRNKQDNFLFYNSDSDNPDDGKYRQKERPLQNS